MKGELDAYTKALKTKRAGVFTQGIPRVLNAKAPWTEDSGYNRDAHDRLIEAHGTPGVSAAPVLGPNVASASVEGRFAIAEGETYDSQRRSVTLQGETPDPGEIVAEGGGEPRGVPQGSDIGRGTGDGVREQLEIFNPDELQEGLLEGTLGNALSEHPRNVGQKAGDTRSGVRTVENVIPDLQKGLPVRFKGQRITSGRGLAILGRVLRDPRAETLHIFYLKGETVVGHEALSNRHPYNAASFLL